MRLNFVRVSYDDDIEFAGRADLLHRPLEAYLFSIGLGSQQGMYWGLSIDDEAMSLRLNFQKEEFVLRDSFLFFPGEINLLIIYFYDRESAPSVPSDLLFAEKRHVP